MRSFYVTLLLLGSLTQANAFDFGGMLQQAAPITDAVVSNTSVGQNPLVKNLTSSLGVTPSQAIGGSAALLGEAKKDMKPADFNSLTSSMPAISSLMSAVPVGKGTLASQFASYGMKPEMIDKFTPFITDYVSKGTTPGMAQLVLAAIQ